MSTKIARTNVTAADLELARGGHLPVGRDYRLTCEMPVSYDPDSVTADDILHDSAIRIVAAVEGPAGG